MKFVYPFLILAALGSLSARADNEKISFEHDIKPIFEFNCMACHFTEKDKGDLNMETLEWVMKSKDVLVPGQPDKSSIYTLCILPPDDDDIMPPIKKEERDYPLSKKQTDRIKKWIEQGADWPKDSEKLRPRKRLPKKIDFVEHIQPILEYKCVSCHYEGKKKGKLRLDTKEFAFAKEDVLIPGDPWASSFWHLTILPADDDDVMPPDPEPLLEPTEIALIRRWIEEGAAWPDGLEPLLPKKEKSLITGLGPVELYEKLGFKPGVSDEPLKPYTEELAGCEIGIEFVPIPGGEFMMGGSNGENGEVVPFKTRINDFWMASKETTWDLYELWMLDIERENRAFFKTKPNELDLVADGVTRPTPPYTDMTFSMGKEGYPAICMTQLATKVFSMWISAKTGRFYRLPTAAEWEYACRAGTTTAFHWGDDPKQANEYGWHEDNSDWKYQPVGQKKPNPWGLYDMHGNVWEWVLDAYGADSYKAFVGDPVEVDPIALPTDLFPRAVRGGSWDDPVSKMRSASSLGSEPDWKKKDPQIPKSVWYHTDAHWIGFRLVRPRKVPPPEELGKYWPSRKELEGIPGR